MKVASLTTFLFSDQIPPRTIFLLRPPQRRGALLCVLYRAAPAARQFTVPAASFSVTSENYSDVGTLCAQGSIDDPFARRAENQRDPRKVGIRLESTSGAVAIAGRPS